VRGKVLDEYTLNGIALREGFKIRRLTVHLLEVIRGDGDDRVFNFIASNRAHRKGEEDDSVE
jgi:hypothetical protein